MSSCENESIFISPLEAARLLGVSIPTVRRSIARGELEAARLGARVLVPRAALRGLIGGGKL